MLPRTLPRCSPCISHPLMKSGSSSPFPGEECEVHKCQHKILDPGASLQGCFQPPHPPTSVLPPPPLISCQLGFRQSLTLSGLSFLIWK